MACRHHPGVPPEVQALDEGEWRRSGKGEGGETGGEEGSGLSGGELAWG